MSDAPDPERLKALEDRIRGMRKTQEPKPRIDEHYSAASQGWRMVIELVSGLGIGFGIGYGLTSSGDAAHPSGAVHIAGLRGRGEDDASHRPGVPGEKRGGPVRQRRRGIDVATEEHSEGLAFHPMDQFIVKPLFGGDEVGVLTVTNVTLWMAIAVLGIVALFVLGTRGRAVIPSRTQSVAELAYGFVHKMVEDVAGHDAVKFFPYIFTLFIFIVFSNFLGLLPKAFTPTSHIAVTAFLALAVFLTVTIVGFVKHGLHFLGLFWVSSAPLPLRPVLALIEVISYFVRPVSHPSDLPAT